MAPERTARPGALSLPGKRNSALASAALTSVALLGQTANAAASPGDEAPSREEVSRRVSSLYDQAESDTGTYNATRAAAKGPRARADRPADAGHRPGASARDAESGRGAPAVDSVARQWFEAARAKLGPTVAAALTGDRTPDRPRGTRSARPAERTAPDLTDLALPSPGRPALELPAAPIAELTAGPIAAPALPAPAAESQQSTLKASKEQNQRKIERARALLSAYTTQQVTAPAELDPLTAPISTTDTWDSVPALPMDTRAVAPSLPEDTWGTTPAPPEDTWGATPALPTGTWDTTPALPTGTWDTTPALPTGTWDTTTSAPVADDTWTTPQAPDTGTWSTAQNPGDAPGDGAVAPAPESWASTPASDPAPAPALTPAPEDTRATRALDFARAQLGKPCVWGTTGPDAYDAAGLTRAAWRSAGITLPRSPQEQATAGRGIAVTAAEPGDLVLFHSAHVGIYSGDGMMIHAPGPGSVIREESIHYAGESAIHSIVRPV
ncbi:NlpC/P60 family protein [Streptomyces sp. M41]|uniref:C40 family peptidase n=1 Tax=Streptomyces sp. M41 TaxID=3059412 RepID=UPI00374CE798